MPEWTEAPEVVLHDALAVVLTELNEQIQDGPSFEEVAGVPLGQLTKHAATAVGAFMQMHDTSNPDSWVQIYTLGFLVGSKYGAKHPVNTSHEREPDDREAKA